MPLRELWNPKWADGFIRAIEERRGSSKFTYYLAVIRVVGDVNAWETEPRIRENLRENPLKFLPLETMWAEVLSTVTRTPAGSEIGRLAQLLKAAGLTAPSPVASPDPGAHGKYLVGPSLLSRSELLLRALRAEHERLRLILRLASAA